MLRVGILGMGRWGQTWLRVLDREPHAEVVAVAARGRRGDVASRASRLRIYDDYRSLLDEQEVDAVIVALPPADHLEALQRAVAAGLPVLCEKPLVSSPHELQAVVALAARDGASVRVNQNYRLRAWSCAVHHHLPAIGRLRRVEIEFAQPELTDGARAVLAHPLLADMAIHHLDLLRYLTGQEAQVIEARVGRPADAQVWGMTDVDAALSLDGGATVTYRATWAARERVTSWDGEWVFEGEEGRISMRDLTVRIETEGQPLRAVPTSPLLNDEDLLVSWRGFTHVLDGGDSRHPATVADNARSLALVFDVAAAADVPDPGARLPSPLDASASAP